MASRNFTDEQKALEPGVVSVFGSFVGAGDTACLLLDADVGSAAFEVGEVVTGTTSTAFGTIYEIQAEAGNWAAALALDADGGSVEFAVAEVVIGQTSGAFGTVYRIDTSAGDWDPANHSGTATLILTSVTGTFQNDEVLLGTVSGAAVANGTGTATAEGTATLVLTDVTGTFQNNEELTGDVTGVAQADGVGAAGAIVGAPTSVKGKGISSIRAYGSVAGEAVVAGDSGKFTVTLEDEWAGFLGAHACVIDTTSADDWEMTVVSEAVSTSKTVTVQFFKGGAATTPTSDEKVCLELTLSTMVTDVPEGF